jgi:hypothetical protein
LQEVEFSAPIHLAFDKLQLGDLAFGLPLDQGKAAAARTAALSLTTPLANDATKLDFAHSSHGSRWAGDRVRIIAWKAAIGRGLRRASARRLANARTGMPLKWSEGKASVSRRRDCEFIQKMAIGYCARPEVTFDRPRWRSIET